MALQTWVARFVVDGGRVTEEGRRLRSFQRRRLDEPEIDLHLLADPSGPRSEDLSAQALEAIGRLFTQDQLSLTGGLRRAFLSTHETLLDWNRRSLAGDRVNTGVIAAALDANLVYLARCGPGLLYLWSNGNLQRLQPLPQAVTPLGEAGLDPEIQRLQLAAGDVLIAAPQALLDVLDEEALTGLLQRGSEEALPELYLLVRDLPAFALFAIICSDTESKEAAARDEIADAPAAVPSPQVRAAPPNGGQDRALATVATLAPEAQVSSARTLPARTPGLNFDPPVATGPDDKESTVLLTAPEPLDISRTVVRLRNSASRSRSDYPRTTGLTPLLRFRLGPRPVALVAVAGLLILLAILIVPNVLQEDRAARVERLLASAQQGLNAARIEQEPASKRDLLEETRRLTAEVLRVETENATALDLRQQAAADLSILDAVFDLGPMTTVASLSRQITGEVSITRLLVAGGRAYMLDAAGGRIIFMPLAAPGLPGVIYREGESYLGTPARKPAYFTWEGGEQDGRLLVLDSERKLFEIRPGAAPAPLPLRRTNSWASVAGIAAYDGNLYVLDPRGNQVHRYLPAAAGFDSEPGSSLNAQTNLADADGIAVAGDITLYFKDGGLRRYRNGAEIGFSLAGIDRHPRLISDLKVLKGADEVYIADAGNKRIVVAGKDGVFRRQLVSSAFTDIRALAVDASGGQAYVLVGDTLLSAAIIR